MLSKIRETEVDIERFRDIKREEGRETDRLRRRKKRMVSGHTSFDSLKRKIINPDRKRYLV